MLNVDLYIFYTMKTNKNKGELAWTPWAMWCLYVITHRACRPVLKIIHQEVKYWQQISLLTVKLVFTGFSFPHFSWVWLLVCVCFADGVTVGCSGSTNPSWNWKVNSQPIWKHHTFFLKVHTLRWVLSPHQKNSSIPTDDIWLFARIICLLSC